MEPHTLVVARYQENLHWLLRVPRSIRVVVYNKGEPITDPLIIGRAARIEPRVNIGREADTYLFHLSEYPEDGPSGGYTIFCQGDPFKHSPDFLKLLRVSDHWADIQTLSLHWLVEHHVPPSSLIEAECGEHLSGLRIRSEVFSLSNWHPTRFADDGTLLIARDYLAAHDLPNGTNIATHFLKSAGLHELAEEARTCEFGRFAYGAIFAVRNECLRNSIPLEARPRLLSLSSSKAVHPWIMERLWLHLFGIPFIPAIRRSNVLRPAESHSGSTHAWVPHRKTSIGIFSTITPEYEESCREWLVTSVRKVEPDTALTVECFASTGGSTDFQSDAFNLHNQIKFAKLAEWIDAHLGETILITDSDIVYLKPFVDEMLNELGDCDIALAREYAHGAGFNIGQMVVRCTQRAAVFFRNVRDDLRQGSWDQEAVNRLLPESGLKARPLSLRFPNTTIWEKLSRKQKSEALSYHATSTNPRDGKSSLQLKSEFINEVVSEWKFLNENAGAV